VETVQSAQAGGNEALDTMNSELEAERAKGAAAADKVVACRGRCATIHHAVSRKRDAKESSHRQWKAFGSDPTRRSMKGIRTVRILHARALLTRMQLEMYRGDRPACREQTAPF